MSSSFASSLYQDAANVGIMKSYFIGIFIGIFAISFICSGILALISTNNNKDDKEQNKSKIGGGALLICLGSLFILFAIINIYYMRHNKLAAATSGASDILSLTNSLGSLLNSK